MVTILPECRFVLVSKDYVSRNDDELDLHVGNVVIYNEAVDGWASGISGERKGWFPLNFTSELSNETNEENRSPAVNKHYTEEIEKKCRELSTFNLNFKQNISKFEILIKTEKTIFGKMSAMIVECKKILKTLVSLINGLEESQKASNPCAGREIFNYFLNCNYIYLQYIEQYLLNHSKVSSKEKDKSGFSRTLPDNYNDDYSSFSQFFYSPIVNLQKISQISLELSKNLPDNDPDRIALLKAYNGFCAIMEAKEYIRKVVMLFVEILKAKNKEGKRYCEVYKEPVMVIKVMLNDKENNSEARYISLHPSSFLIFSRTARSGQFRLQKEFQISDVQITEDEDENSSDNFTIQVGGSDSYSASVEFENSCDSKFFFRAFNALSSGKLYEPYWRNTIKQDEYVEDSMVSWSLKKLRVDRTFHVQSEEENKKIEIIVTKLKKYISSLLPENIEIPVGYELSALYVTTTEVQVQEEESYSGAVLKELTSRLILLEQNYAKLTEEIEILKKNIKPEST